MDGEWEPPVIQNPEYKVVLGLQAERVHSGEHTDFHSPSSFLLLPQGEWKPRQIDNPDYKGTWIHPEIDNPEYSPDSSIYAYENFAVLGLDLWQVRCGGNRRVPRGPQMLRITQEERDKGGIQS